MKEKYNSSDDERDIAFFDSILDENKMLESLLAESHRDVCVLLFCVGVLAISCVILVF